ncbi:response regulator transcription factor [Bradyrhizobium sp. BRP22]|uniref:LuxR C-terminal-related transcriptional regulator n=1 Tax=Bradyrhizobium sp. BRP22 TaxID=2793821 RepID=UPI001CD7B629|nr:response regulator transcription factor [Bradyrhizobium sp. BRP22]MCA1454691.1 response regulator transcription factor [Bradyrhizobium sp. BRP22]
MTRFLIVEDHPLFCEALELALRMAVPDADILQATSIDEAIDLLSSSVDGIDLILLDLSTPGTTGLSGIIRIRKAFPRNPVVVVSAHQDPQIVASALSLGISGYIPKSSSKQELAHSIAEALRGSICLPKNYRAVTRRRRGPAQELLKRLHDLTPQQLRVLEMLRRGLQNKQIAYELNISETTVKVHVSDILRKLNVLSRTRVIVEMSKIDFANLAANKAVTDRSESDAP